MFIEQVGLAILKRRVDPGLLQSCLERLADGLSREALVEMLLASDEARIQADTPLFVPPGHYYSPVGNPATIRPKDGDQPVKTLPGVDIDHTSMLRLWEEMLPAMTTCPFPAAVTSTARYAFENDAYSWGDGLVLHAMIRQFPPKRIIEVGSGWSSACIIDTIEAAGLACSFKLIDIDLTTARSRIGQYSGQIEMFEQPVQQIDPALFTTLESGDILFIDSSHVMKTDSDLNHLLFNVLPVLKSGVRVHFHDIFWPFDYPDGWSITENRSWNEAYALRAYLTDSIKWKLIWFNDYFAKLEADRARKDCPDFLRNSGGAVWLLKE